MIDALLHIIGFCPDHHNHVNIIMFINELMKTNYCWCWVKHKISKINLFFKKSV